MAEDRSETVSLLQNLSRQLGAFRRSFASQSRHFRLDLLTRSPFRSHQHLRQAIVMVSNQSFKLRPRNFAASYTLFVRACQIFGPLRNAAHQPL